jgi:hypothetical protein
MLSSAAICARAVTVTSAGSHGAGCPPRQSTARANVFGSNARLLGRYLALRALDQAARPWSNALREFLGIYAKARTRKNVLRYAGGEYFVVLGITQASKILFILLNKLG